MTRKKKQRKKTGIFRGILLFINLVLVLALLVAYAAPFINPEKFLIPAFFGLAYPYLVLLNGAFVLIWMIAGKWYLLISLILLLAGIPRHTPYIQPGHRCTIVSDSQGIKIISFNTHNLTENPLPNKSNPSKDAIYDFLDLADAQLVCMQEFTTTGTDHLNEIKALGERMELPYHYLSNYYKSNPTKTNGLIIFSRFPVLNTGTLRDNRSKAFSIYTDILIHDADTVRIYNVHLESVYFHRKDYDFVKNITTPGRMDQDISKGSASIFKKLKDAYQKKVGQVTLLREHMNLCPYPMILCGDFNVTPTSFTYRQLKKGMKDVFCECGRGFASTFRNAILIPLRIDFILTDKSFSCCNYKTEKLSISDHYPVSVRVLIPGTDLSGK
ncbi:MAG: endonuclease/exonuclease/phosphatase family protein [Lentimicrobiaceae bacterium]|nr:endonuclease/exonuclease/phosphatase family protein [Lentimicrobiaceae bacterium]